MRKRGAAPRIGSSDFWRRDCRYQLPGTMRFRWRLLSSSFLAALTFCPQQLLCASFSFLVLAGDDLRSFCFSSPWPLSLVVHASLEPWLFLFLGKTLSNGWPMQRSSVSRRLGSSGAPCLMNARQWGPDVTWSVQVGKENAGTNSAVDLALATWRLT